MQSSFYYAKYGNMFIINSEEKMHLLCLTSYKWCLKDSSSSVFVTTCNAEEKIYTKMY